MPPKVATKKEFPVSLPAIDDEVQLPEGIGPVPDPCFSFTVVHLVSHAFVVEGDGHTPLRDFDPCALLVANLKDENPEDPLSKCVVPVERDELVALSEGGPLAKGLRKKVEKESSARRRRKVNAVRSQAIAQAQGCCNSSAQQLDNTTMEAPKVDLLLIVVGYPMDAEELDEVRDEGIFGLAEMTWVSVYLSGSSLREAPVREDMGGEDSGPPRRALRACEPPQILQHLHDAIVGAELGSGLANSTISTVLNSHEFARVAEADRVREVVCGVARVETERRLQFDRWISSAPKVSMPQHCPDNPDTRLYQMLADSLDPSHQNVPALLHCLCEQVSWSLRGDQSHAGATSGLVAFSGSCISAPLENGSADELRLLERYFDRAHEDLLQADVYRTSLHAAEVAATSAVHCGAARSKEDLECQEVTPPFRGFPDAGEKASLVLPYLDRSACLHAGNKLPGGISVASVAEHILSHLRLPGVGCADRVQKERLTSALRSAARNRMYSLMPETPIVEMEQMLLLHEFEQLLETAQPERKWCLQDRVVRERIPGPLLAQTLLEASMQEAFVDTKYIQQRDCLLIAMHQRVLPGHVLWHSWTGDLRAPLDALCPIPSFNDWSHLVLGGIGSETSASSTTPLSAVPAQPPPRPSRFLLSDARETGYCRVVEKLLVPSDGSVILQTAFQRGLNSTFPSASEIVEGYIDATVRDGGFRAPPRFERRSLKVLTDGIRFGIITDMEWTEKVAQLKERRRERSQAKTQEVATTEAAAAAAAARAERNDANTIGQAQGLPLGELEQSAIDESTASQEGSAPKAVTERRLEDLRFGCLWMSFKDGARCTARMHHERPWYVNGELSYDSAISRPGVLVTYSPTSSLVIQILSNGTVRQLQRVQLQRSGGAIDVADGQEVSSGNDVEVMRTTSPIGVVTRSMLSGRREIYYPGGIRAVRNPTSSEMQSRCTFETKGQGDFTAPYTDSGWGHPFAKPPTMNHKVAGIPGHWVITHADGRRFGRMSVPSRESPLNSFGVDGSTSSVAQDTVRGRIDSSKEHDVGVSESSIHSLLECMQGVLVDGGKIIEYEIDPAPVTQLTDPHTGQSVLASAEGTLIVNDDQGTSRICVLADGTRIAWSQSDDGYKVCVEKERTAQVICHVRSHAIPGSVLTEVECDDGARLEVVPQQLSRKGELVPCDPGSGELEKFSTNASVLLRRPEGTAVLSKGAGEVVILGGTSAASAGQMGTRDASTDGTGYIAHLDRDNIRMRDHLGNTFEVHGDQTVDFNLAVSMGDDILPPHCATPGRPYRHPDADYLPLPKEVPTPRLFAIYGDDEAEELLAMRDVHHALREASEDSNAVIIKDEQLGQAMDGCRCHTILRARMIDPRVLQLKPLELPPIITGIAGLGPYADREDRSSARTFTEFRQFIEYPQMRGEQRASFHPALRRFAALEGRHSADQGQKQLSSTMWRASPDQKPADGGFGGANSGLA